MAGRESAAFTIPIKSLANSRMRASCRDDENAGTSSFSMRCAMARAQSSASPMRKKDEPGASCSRKGLPVAAAAVENPVAFKCGGLEDDVAEAFNKVAGGLGATLEANLNLGFDHIK